ncbi:hypothetical protein ACL6C3_29780 [Capilliphycus salinus ALCB114379]|uniref:hypothetical protein n=1 Tax=Capilliphycus salinus TaxID=2768948 RepID=UPI0039A675BC
MSLPMKGLIPLMIIACGSGTMIEDNKAVAKPLSKTDFIIVQNPENPPEISLSQEGTGTYSLNSRFQGTITFVSLTVNKDGEAELTFRNSEEQLVRFQGEVIRRDPYRMRVSLTDSERLDASGVADIQYSPDNSLIYSIFVAGTVENQIFSINFSR